MSRLNLIQQKIKELDGGAFEKLFDEYLIKKYEFKNIQTLGAHDGTNKVTKGTPDSYVINQDGSYTFIMYGSSPENPYKKLKKDILSCLDNKRTGIEKEKIKKIVCGYCSTNLTVKQTDSLKKLTKIPIELIGLYKISFDLSTNYQGLAYEHLNIPLDTRQIYPPNDFIKIYDKAKTNAPLAIDFMHRKEELEDIKQSILDNQTTLIFGKPGIGKTKLVLETIKSKEFKDYTILCVKNNGELLSSDINIYISTPGKYILFLDDANETSNFKYILNFVNNPPDNIFIKLIMTVRDYARKKVAEDVKEQTTTNEIEIKEFQDNKIKEILETSLGIKNNHYLNRITEIAKGNIRIAIIAGYVSIKESLDGINNVEDIFKSYYGKILNNQNIDKKELYALFVLSFYGAVNIFDDNIVQNFLTLFKINKSDFLNACIELNKKEIIDLYDNKFAKISDQSLKDYILYYVLIERRYISISDLLETAFLYTNEKTIKTINTIFSLFYTKETENYIKKEVIKSWHNAKNENKIEYLKAFYKLNEEESLYCIKEEIDKIPQENFSLSYNDFKDNVNKTLFTEVLSEFKHSFYFPEAIELLLELSNKNRGFALEACRVFCGDFSYDEYSDDLNFEKEFLLLNIIWENFNKQQTFNNCLILLELIKSLLQIENRKIRPTQNQRAINIVTLHCSLTKECKNLRSLIWRILGKLYKKEEYKKYVENLLYNYNINTYDTELRSIFIKYDMNCFKKEFALELKTVSFDFAIILKQLKSQYYFLNIKPPGGLDKYLENRDFFPISIFIENKLKDIKWKDEERRKEEKISKLIENYQIKDYENLFESCKKYEEKNLSNKHLVAQGLNFIFKKLEQTPKFYVEVIKAYFNKNYPFILYTSKNIICSLFNFTNLREIKNLIDKTDRQTKSVLLCDFYKYIPENLITTKLCNEFKNFIKQEITKKQGRIGDIYSLTKYKTQDSLIIENITKLILNNHKNNKYLIEEYIGSYLYEENIEELIKIFEKNIELLEKIYLSSSAYNIDYENYLFEELLKKSGFKFWNRFIRKIITLNNNNSHLYEIFEKTWQKNDHKKYIDVVIKAITELDNIEMYKINTLIAMIFKNHQDTTKNIKDNKKNWFKNYIIKNINNQEKIKLIFEIITDVFDDEKIEFYKSFLNNNSSFEFFEKIPLFSWHYSWSGSQIPVIDKRIKFLKNLYDLMEGIKYIRHKNYINKRIKYEFDSKEDAKQREYIENFFDT